MDDQTTRLNRIEEKLDRVSEAIVSLARMEERMITLFKRMDTYDTKQDILETRVSKIEVNNATQTGSSTWTDKVVWIIIAAGLTAFFTIGKQ
jgi:hypothetical protein